MADLKEILAAESRAAFLTNAIYAAILDGYSDEDMIAAVEPYLRHEKPIVRTAAVGALASTLPNSAARAILEAFVLAASPGAAKSTAEDALFLS